MPILTDSIVQTDFLYIEGFKNGLQVGVKKCFEEGFDKGLKKALNISFLSLNVGRKE